MNRIKFSHDSPKLHGQRTAWLLHVHVAERDRLADSFIDYETDGGKYQLPSGRYLILTFKGEHHIPFATARWFTEEMLEYYASKLDQRFDIVIEEATE